MQHGELRTNRCPWFIDKLFKLSYTASPTLVPQEAVIPTLHPASTRSESTSGTVWVSPSHEPVETEKKKETNRTRFVICQNG